MWRSYEKMGLTSEGIIQHAALHNYERRQDVSQAETFWLEYPIPI